MYSQQASMTGALQAGMEYLTFTLGNEDYGMAISQIQEIRSYEKPTHIATAPEYVKGVINLRGVIIPVVDLRLKLQLGEATYDDTTAVIVTAAGGKSVGFVVDRVNDVIALTADQMHPVPDMHRTGSTDHMTGLASIEGRTLILVDAQQLTPA